MENLPEEMILHIMSFCDIKSLGRLSSSHSRFRNIINRRDKVWQRYNQYSLGTNCASPRFIEKCNPVFNMKRRCQVAKSWKYGKYHLSPILRYSKSMPWLVLERRELYLSQRANILIYNRDKDGCIIKYPKLMIGTHKDNISKFVTNNREIITVGRDGYLKRWRKKNQALITSYRARKDLRCVCTLDDIIFCGTSNSVMVLNSSSSRIHLLQEINMTSIVLSVGAFSSRKCFVVGLRGTDNIHPLQLHDLEKMQNVATFGNNYRNGASILDIHVEDENTFLTCGYDTTIRLWDVRCPHVCVGSWIDKYDNGSYCVKSDNHMTIVSGATRNGLVAIWDKRCPVAQLQYVKKFETAIYSIDFDSGHVYAASDVGVAELVYH